MSHITACVGPQCKTSLPTPKATGTQGRTHSGSVLGQECLRSALNKFSQW